MLSAEEKDRIYREEFARVLGMGDDLDALQNIFGFMVDIPFSLIVRAADGKEGLDDIEEADRIRKAAKKEALKVRKRIREEKRQREEEERLEMKDSTKSSKDDNEEEDDDDDEEDDNDDDSSTYDYNSDLHTTYTPPQSKTLFEKALSVGGWGIFIGIIVGFARGCKSFEEANHRIVYKDEPYLSLPFLYLPSSIAICFGIFFVVGLVYYSVIKEKFGSSWTIHHIIGCIIGAAIGFVGGVLIGGTIALVVGIVVGIGGGNGDSAEWLAYPIILVCMFIGGTFGKDFGGGPT